MDATPCLRCGERGNVTVSVDGGESIHCRGCGARYTAADVRAVVDGWGPVLARMVRDPPQTPRPTRPAVDLCAPCSILCGPLSAPVGATVYLALSALFAAGGRMAADELSRAVWGTSSPQKRALWSLCHRANLKLAAVNAPVRACTEGQSVYLC